MKGIRLKRYMPLALAVLFMPCHALAFDLTMPVDCHYGKTCFISNYFDTSMDKDEAPEDYTCSGLTTKGSTSTTFMLKDTQEMRKGAAVLAAEDGTVSAVRDGMDDVSVHLAGRALVRGRECGNGVILEHKRGYVTEYCHLQKGSIVVAKGDKVQKGGRIALVGMSGDAEYPELEFRVRRRQDVFDPFLGDERLHCGSLKAYPLWDRQTRKKLQYIPTLLLNSGFVNKVPYAMGAREGKFRRKKLSTQDTMIVFWLDIFGVHKDDKLHVQILYPDGKVLDEESRVFKKDKRRHFQFMGKRLKQAAWPAGKYEGRVVLTRVVSDEEKNVIDATIPLQVVGEAASKGQVAPDSGDTKGKSGDSNDYGNSIDMLEDN